MSHRLTISSEAYLSDCTLEEGATVYVEDSGKVFRCIQGYEGQLTWELDANRRYDFPEDYLQLQEIESYSAPEVTAESPGSTRLKLRLKKTTPRYLH
jgi:hypothetical protein